MYIFGAAKRQGSTKEGNNCAVRLEILAAKKRRKTRILPWGKCTLSLDNSKESLKISEQ